MQSTTGDASAEETLYTYLVESDDAPLLRALYTVWRLHKAGELPTAAAYEQAYITQWEQVVGSHERFKYYPKDTRDAALARAATIQRQRDDVSFD